MSNKVKITIVLPERLDKMVEVYASTNFTTKSGVIAKALSEFFKSINSKVENKE